MDLNACKDDYSRAVVRAIAAAAGVAASVPERDQDSIDLNLVAPDTHDAGGPQLDVQLKCSQNIDPSSDRFSFELPVKNYNDLRRLPVYVPRVLVLVHVPADRQEWIACGPEQMVLKRCAYWTSLAGEPETPNTSTVAVTVPTEQVFGVEALLSNLKRPGELL